MAIPRGLQSAAPRRQLLTLCLALFGSAVVARATDLSGLPGENWAPLRAEASTLGKPSWRPMLAYLAALHERGTHPASPPFEYPWEDLGPGYGYGPAFGNWDLAHEMIDELPTCPVHVRHQLLNDLRLQLPSGFLPGSVYMPGSPSAPGAVAARKGEAVFDRGTQSHPPLWVEAADRYLQLVNDPVLKRECLERASRQIAWFEAHRQAPGGGFYYNDILLHKWESGVDDGVRFDKVATGPKACVDATSHVYWMYAHAAAWSASLGEDPTRYTKGAAALAQFIRTRLWDSQSGFFYDSWAAEDPALRTEAYEGIWPLVVGAATPDQAARVINEWLLNPRRFRTPHPIPTVGAEDPHFSLRMWRGPAWNSMTYWAAFGCMRYGRPDAARVLLEAALDDTAAQYARTGTIWEYFHPMAGHPEALTRKPYTQRNMPWTDYLGHNPLFAMARLWEACAPKVDPPAR